MPFQSFVNRDLPLAVEGDFASNNAWASTNAGEGALVAGYPGLRIARFAWIQGDNRSALNVGFGNRVPDGFVSRQQGTALITQYLGESSMTILPGFMVTLHDEGDFFVKVAGTVAPTRKMQAYASFVDGSVSFGAPPAGATGTGSIGSTFTATTVAGTATQITTSAVTGLISAGDTISGTGVPAGTTIINQVSGTTGGAGVYNTSNPTTANAATITSYGNVLNVTAANGVLLLGFPVSGTGIPANATLASQTSGQTGGIGVYTISTPATAYAASTALAMVTGIGTNFYAASNCAVGELVKISTWGKL